MRSQAASWASAEGAGVRPQQGEEGSGANGGLGGGQIGGRGTRDAGRGRGRGKGDAKPLGLRAARRQREQAEAEDFAASTACCARPRRGAFPRLRWTKRWGGPHGDDGGDGSGSEGE